MDAKDTISKLCNTLCSTLHIIDMFRDVHLTIQARKSPLLSHGETMTALLLHVRKGIVFFT